MTYAYIWCCPPGEICNLGLFNPHVLANVHFLRPSVFMMWCIIFHQNDHPSLFDYLTVVGSKHIFRYLQPLHKHCACFGKEAVSMQTKS